MRKHAKKIAQPEQVKQKVHNWKTKLFYGIVMGIATVATVLAILFVVPINSDVEEEQHVIDVIREKKKITHPVEKAVKSLLAELEKNNNPWITGKQMERRINELTTEDINVEYSLNFSNAPALDGKTVGADGVIMRSVQDKKMYLHTDISIARVKMLLADIYGNDDELYLCLPEITEKESILLQTENIDKQFNESKLSDYLNKKIPMELSVYPYETYPIEIPNEIWLDKILVDIFEETEVDETDKLDKDDSVTVGDEDVLELRTYEVRFENIDGEFEIALDKNKNIRVLKFPSGFEYDDIIIQKMELQFLGEETVTDIVTIKAEISCEKTGGITLGDNNPSDNVTGGAMAQLRIDAEITDNISAYINLKQEDKELSFRVTYLTLLKKR